MYELIAASGDQHWFVQELSFHTVIGDAADTRTVLEGFSGDRITLVLRPSEPAVRERAGEIIVGELIANPARPEPNP